MKRKIIGYLLLLAEMTLFSTLFGFGYYFSGGGSFWKMFVFCFCFLSLIGALALLIKAGLDRV